MSQELREHKDEGPAPRARVGSAQAEDPGKRTLTEAASPRDSAANAEIQRLRRETKDAYVGLGAFAKNGILDYKLVAVQETTDYLTTAEDPIETSKLSAAVAIGVAAAAGALTAGIASGVVAAAVVAGGEAAVQVLPQAFQRNGEPAVDPIAFCSCFDTALRQGWPESVDKLHSQMHTLEGARKAHGDTLSLASKPEVIKRNQRNELIDAWVNALKTKTQKGSSAGGIGTKNFSDSTAGRLHIEGVFLESRREDSTVVHLDRLRAKLTGVRQLARNQLLHRRVSDIRVARTIEGFVRQPPGSHLPKEAAQFAFGAAPNGGLVRPDGEVPELTRKPLAGIEGAGTWGNGLAKIWHMMKSATLSELGVTNVEH